MSSINIMSSMNIMPSHRTTWVVLRGCSRGRCDTSSHHITSHHMRAASPRALLLPSSAPRVTLLTYPSRVLLGAVVRVVTAPPRLTPAAHPSHYARQVAGRARAAASSGGLPSHDAPRRRAAHLARRPRRHLHPAPRALWMTGRGDSGALGWTVALTVGGGFSW